MQTSRHLKIFCLLAVVSLAASYDCWNAIAQETPAKEVAPTLFKTRQACSASAIELSTKEEDAWTNGYTDVGTNEVIFRQYEVYTYGCTPSTVDKVQGFWRSLVSYEFKKFDIYAGVDECKALRYNDNTWASRANFVFAFPYYANYSHIKYSLVQETPTPNKVANIRIQIDTVSKAKNNPVRFFDQSRPTDPFSDVAALGLFSEVAGRACCSVSTLCLNGTKSENGMTFCRDPNVQILNGASKIMTDKGFKSTALSLAMSFSDTALRCAKGPNYVWDKFCSGAMTKHNQKPPAIDYSGKNSNAFSAKPVSDEVL